MSAELRPLRTEAEQTLSAEFRAAIDTLPGDGEARRKAFALFERAGLPHRRVEAWKYTDLRALMRHAAPLAVPGAGGGVPSADLLAGLDRAVIAIVDGQFRSELSDLERLPGVTVSSLAADLAAGDVDGGGLLDPAEDALVALNAAMMTDGAIVRVAEGAIPARAIEIRHVSTATAPQATYVRSRLDVAAGASLRLIETHAGPTAIAYQSFPATELRLGDGATAVVVKLQAEGDRALHIGSFAARLGAGASLKHLTVTAGGAISRSQNFITMAGAGARLGASGATMLAGRAHGDVSLSIDHEAPGSESRILYKNVVDGEAEGAFQGRIVVRREAQKTDGKMMVQSLLLSDTAEFASKPELEIYADDVQCGHGSTSGQIDEDMLFYFLARGIPRPEAERLLIMAFLAAAIEATGDEAMIAALQPLVVEWLGRQRGPVPK